MPEAVAPVELDPLGEVPAMAESKAQATKRLRYEGRWTKFQTHRANWKKKLMKARKQSGSAVNEDSWAFALVAFPPCHVPVEEVAAVKKAGPAIHWSKPVSPGPANFPGRFEKKVEVSDATVPAADLPGVLAVAAGDERPGAADDTEVPGGGEPVATAETAPAPAPEAEGGLEPAATTEISPPPEPEPYEGPAGGSATPADLLRDILWAYDKLTDWNIKSKSAPSGGAWAMLQFARKNRNEFFRNHLPKAMNAGELDDDEKVAEKFDERQVGVIKGMLERMATEAEDGSKLYCPKCGERLRASL